MTMHLHFHLGPVGGFIAESRRTRDYWAGSFLLSWLAGQAMAAARAMGGTIILPLIQDEIGPESKSWWAWVERLIETKRYHLDPTLAAIEAARRGGAKAGEGPFLGTLTNHFTAQFDNQELARQAGEAAAGAVRVAWKKLADQVLAHILRKFSFVSSAEAARSLGIWDQQIGDESRSPFWEIYWIVARPEGHGPLGQASALDVRKLTRWSPDMETALPENGNLCTMFGGFIDVSGLERRQHNNDFKEFWKAMRTHLIEARYGSAIGSDAACLDLRPNESLSAPALVKRLFPLLAIRHESALSGAVGWVPELRNAMPKELQEPPWFSVYKATEAPKSERTDIKYDLDTQSALLWPSTSYIAATHWIARAQRSAPAACATFAQRLRDFGRQYAVAEQSLWLRAVHEPFPDASPAPPLAWVDGAMLHKSRLERAEGGNLALRPAAETALNRIQESFAIPAPALRAYFRNDMKVGAPGSYYAIVRADGDKVGETLGNADSDTRVAISRLFLAWADDVRGNEAAASREGRLGPVAARNGIILYAGADELLIFAPPEDAFDIARAIRQCFVTRRDEIAAKLDENSKVGKLTISASISYANIRAPLRWAIQQSGALLDSVAKEAANRDALALALFDIDGHRSRWAAQWDAVQIEAFSRTLKLALERLGWLWSNEFYHRIADTLRAFVVPPEHADFPALVKYLASSGGGPGRPDERDRQLAEKLVAMCVKERAGAPDPTTAGALFTLLTPFDPRKGTAQTNVGHLTLGLLDILRELGAHWRMDNDDYSPVPAAKPNPGVAA